MLDCFTAEVPSLAPVSRPPVLEPNFHANAGEFESLGEFVGVFGAQVGGLREGVLELA